MTEPCSHHWIIEPANGPTSQGICQVCQEVRGFSNHIAEKSWGETGVQSAKNKDLDFRPVEATKTTRKTSPWSEERYAAVAERHQAIAEFYATTQADIKRVRVETTADYFGVSNSLVKVAIKEFGSETSEKSSTPRGLSCHPEKLAERRAQIEQRRLEILDRYRNTPGSTIYRRCRSVADHFRLSPETIRTAVLKARQQGINLDEN